MYMFTRFPNGQVYVCAIIPMVLHLFYEDLGVGSHMVGTHQDLCFEACFRLTTKACTFYINIGGPCLHLGTFFISAFTSDVPQYPEDIS